jgi:ABC-type cobalamin/Fe3+-siderophores transport system ATPase subunit
VLGPSGSGKSTLLDLLAQRKSQGDVSGTITYAGQEASTALVRRCASYVEQTGAASAAPREGTPLAVAACCCCLLLLPAVRQAG